MIYGSLQAEFMETKYNSHIHGYGTSSYRYQILGAECKAWDIATLHS